MIIKEYETSSMSAAQVAPQAPILVTTIIRVLRFLRNIALRYAQRPILYDTLRLLLFGWFAKIHLSFF